MFDIFVKKKKKKKGNVCLGRDIKRIAVDWSMDRKDRILYLVNLGGGCECLEITIRAK